jgi:N-acetylglutamate synthase-like GNAT family acetyltransferase
MNTELVTRQPSSGAHRVPRPARRVRLQRSPDAVSLRAATAADVPAIHALIEAHLDEGHLLPRSLGELRVHAPRFVVAVAPTSRRSPDDTIVACAELAPLSARVAEVRSLVVDHSARAQGIGRRLVHELRQRAVREGFERLCAFTHDAGYFVRKGFSLVPHAWVPEKIARDCSTCALFRSCGQHAVLLPLEG